MREAIDAYKLMADEKKFEFDEETEGYPPDLDILVEGIEIIESEEGNEVERIHKFLRLDSGVWGGENVYDVYTKSPGIALDGTKYREW